MNSKKIKNRYENSTIFLKQNIKGQIPCKLSDKENQINYRKNNSNISSKTNNINSKNKNTKVNQNLNRANSSINNSKITINNNNNSLCNNIQNNQQNNSTMKLEKISSPLNQNKKKINNTNNNSFKHLNNELKNFKYIFDTYDNDNKEDKKTSILFIQTEESKKNNSSKKQSSKKKIISDINSIKNITHTNIINNTNLNIVKNKQNLGLKTDLKVNENKNMLSKSENKISSSNNNNKNSFNNLTSVPGSSYNEPLAYINNERNKNKKIVKGEVKKIEEKNSLSKSAKKYEIKNSVDINNKNNKNQIIIKYNNQINRIRGKSPKNENSNITEINGKEITFLNNNLININNIISDTDINSKSKKYDKKNNIKKSIINFTKKNKILKRKKNFSTNKIKYLEKKNYLSNKNSNNDIKNGNNAKFSHKKIEKDSNYNKTDIKIPILEKIIENKVNINKITDKIIERKISDSNLNSVRKKEIKIYEKLNMQNNFIKNEQKSPKHQHQQQNLNLNNINNKNEKEQNNNIKTQKNNYIKKIDNNIKKYNINKYNLKGSSNLRVNSVKGNNNNHYNRFFQNQRYKSNWNSESKKNNNKNNKFNSKNNLRGYSTLTNRIKSLSFQNNKLNNEDFFKYPVNEIKDDEIIVSNNNKINTEENKNDIKINVNNCTIIINISSNWGNKKYLGINEIELFDKKNRKIKISECIVIGGNNQNINNIFNNKMHTMNESNMWVTNIKNQKSSYDLKIKLVIYTRTKNNNKDKNEKNSDDLFNEINYILIWNYNGIELNKGIKKIEVLDKYGNIYFVGIVSKGEHSITNYHPYKIKIHQIKNNNKREGVFIRNKNLISSYKHDTEHTIECNNNSNNLSIAQKNNSVNENKKNLYYSVIRLSSKKEELYSEIKELFPPNLNFNQVSSSRSCHKDLIIGNKLTSNKMNENKIYKKISNNKNRRNFNEKKNKNQINIDNKKKNNNINIKYKQNNKVSQECLFDIPNLKLIIPEEKEIIKESNTTESNNILIEHKIGNSSKLEYNKDNKISILSLSENQNMVLFTRNNSDNTLPYILFQNIKINILSNYGNKSFVGLTGLNLIDMNNKVIDIEDVISIGAMPKDLNTIYKNKNDNRIFENLFNGINNTVDENNMWLTVMNNPYIEIWFEKPMTLSKLEIWNYNEVLNLDKGAKEIEIMFDSDENRKYYFILWKGLGIDYFDYHQTIFIEKLPEITKKTIQLKYNHLKFRYNTNYLPIGFIIKIIFVRNFGNTKIISLKNIEFFDENNKKLEKYKVINENKNNKNKKLKNNFFYYHDLYDFRKNAESLCKNLIFICFEEIVQIKYIKIQNSNIENLINSSTRDIQIFLDDILIFEGVLNQRGESILLFDKKELNNFKNIVNITKKESKYIFKEIINDKYHLLTNLNT